MVILGVDPGFGTTGYGLLSTRSNSSEVPQLIEAGFLDSNKKKNFPERLDEIYKHFLNILKEFSPAAVAVEDVFSVGAFPRSAIFIGHVRGVILLAAAQRAIPTFTYYPIQVKKILLGYGRGTKLQTQKMVQRTLGLDSIPRPDDVADALAMALCHAYRSRS
ncbi:MAG: crossover junction endodeoxyribonuclease RuvC [Elusimicrobia bacterium]|nr:crossover junction endodeoxyribonuclease RuvC [Elusimicrobiota bacterium]